MPERDPPFPAARLHAESLWRMRQHLDESLSPEARALLLAEIARRERLMAGSRKALASYLRQHR